MPSISPWLSTSSIGVRFGAWAGAAAGPLMFQHKNMCAFSSFGAGAAAGCRCCVRLGAWVLVLLQGAAALCAWKLACWCRCRVPLLCALGGAALGSALGGAWGAWPLQGALCALWSLGAGAAAGFMARPALGDGAAAGCRWTVLLHVCGPLRFEARGWHRWRALQSDPAECGCRVLPTIFLCYLGSMSP